MTKQLFINLPVCHLENSVAFYTQLGFSIYPLFTFDDQKCMAWGEHILVMLHPKTFFNSETDKPIVDTKTYLIPSFTLPVDSPENVNAIVERGLKAGGSEPHTIIDEGFMQVRTIEDLDGYQWGIMCIDLDAFKKIKSK